MYIDHSVYPDVDDPPTSLDSMCDRADYVQRICAAWDFNILPEHATFQLFSGWREVFDQFPLPTSPAYHAFRSWFGWEPVTCPPGLLSPTPYYIQLDRLEGRSDDPCEQLI